MIGLYPSFKDGTQNSDFFNIVSSRTGVKFLPFTCARSAIAAGLKAFGIGRMDEILVPPYLGQCVLSAVSRTAFPTMTPSSITKAILVYHQFGFPQKLKEIDSMAKDNGWIKLNDCANTLFTKVNDRYLVEWGDFTVISLSKLYPCGLGGGFYSSRADIYERVSSYHEKLSGSHTERVEHALEQLVKINSAPFNSETVFEINSLYGYLPDLVSFPKGAYASLPSTAEALEKEIAHRKNIWSVIREILPDRVPLCEGEEVAPFAVPVSGDTSELEAVSQNIREELFIDSPVLHFDFARNMLNPDYRASLVIGCHEGWIEESVIQICEKLKKGSA